jgi:pimeloyl-ACP methyl ester carboxylesterase
MAAMPDSMDGDYVHYLEYEGTPGGPTFVLVHALEGSHATWLALAPLLAEVGRVLVIDLIGFGLTPLEGRVSSLEANRALLDRFLHRMRATPAVLVGNSMGAAVALLQARARPDTVEGLVLVGPAVARSVRHGLDPLLVPIFGSTLLPNSVGSWLNKRIEPYGPEWFVRKMLQMCTLDPTKVPDAVVAANVAVAAERMARMPWAPIAFNQASRSTMALLASSRRFWRMMRDVRTPTMMIGGSGDRLIPPRTLIEAQRMRPDWRLEMLDAGHMPQLEDAHGTAGLINSWLGARSTA